MLPIKTILHATDFSPRSEMAFQLACALARDAGARLVVLNVLERPLIVYGGVALAPPPPPLPETERQERRRRLQQVRPADPALAVEHRLEEGDPATAILQVAQELGCDLIVMGTHGRGGLGRLLMGSVADKVVREAPCLVLTVKVPPPAS